MTWPYNSSTRTKEDLFFKDPEIYEHENENSRTKDYMKVQPSNTKCN